MADNDRAFQDQMRNGPKVVQNGYSNLASVQPKAQARCETCGRPISPTAPGSYCYDCYRTMQFFSQDSSTGDQPGEGILDDKTVTPKIAPGA